MKRKKGQGQKVVEQPAGDIERQLPKEVAGLCGI